MPTPGQNSVFDVHPTTGWVTLKKKIDGDTDGDTDGEIDGDIKKIITAQVWANLTISANRTNFLQAGLSKLTPRR